MKSNIFIPKKINVGFQERSDTYTGKLAYIIYFDEKGKLRKEKSWNGWKDDKIDSIIHDNEPMDGFVLNKKVGDYHYGWESRHAYIRIYDPRNFEFEITVENLLYILENCTSEKGKGLVGKFVYGWDGKDLVLLPCDSPDYKSIEEYNTIVHENKSIKAKDLVIGGTYQTKNNEKLIYMGKYEYYYYGGTYQGEKFWFYNREGEYEWEKFIAIKTIPKNKFIQVIDDKCCDDYADLFDEMEHYECYSPIDDTKDEYVGYTLEEFTNKIKEKGLCVDYTKIYNIYSKSLNSKIEIGYILSNNNNVFRVFKCLDNQYYYYDSDFVFESNNIEEVFDKVQPMYKNIYLRNGKLKGGKINNE